MLVLLHGGGHPGDLVLVLLGGLGWVRARSMCSVSCVSLVETLLMIVVI